MAFLGLLKGAFEVAGQGVAVGAVALADEVTRGQVPEVAGARREQERRLHDAAHRVSENARTVGGDVERVLGTTGVTALALSRIVTSPAQLRRLVELIETHDFPCLVRSLQQGAQFPDDFFPNWIRRAGGYFPKFAQVLSVRADLIHNRRVLEQLGRCLEDMPARDISQVRQHLRSQGWDEEVCNGVGEELNTGSVAQVNALTLPDGRAAVVKAAWPNTKQQFQTDFRLFGHARNILSALRLEDERSATVGALFSAVGKNEVAVMREFDMLAESCVLALAADLCGDPWHAAHTAWLEDAPAMLRRLPPALQLLSEQWLSRLPTQAWSVCVPELIPELCCPLAMAMSRAGGESIHRLLSGAAGDEGRREAAGVLIGLAIPFIGWLLLCKSSSHFAHVDPHPGNFRWCSTSRKLWVLDWGSNVTLNMERRRALCMLIRLVADDGDDGSIADTAVLVGLRSDNRHELARLVRGLLNATTEHAAPEAISTAGVDSILDDVADDVVPVVRCLATLGGLLKELQRRIRHEHQQDVPLSLASLWGPFADLGLTL